MGDKRIIEIKDSEDLKNNASASSSCAKDFDRNFPSTINANFDEMKSVSGIFSLDEASEGCRQNCRVTDRYEHDSVVASIKDDDSSSSVPSYMKVYDLGGGAATKISENDDEENARKNSSDVPEYMKYYDLSGGCEVRSNDEHDEENISYDSDSSGSDESHMDEDISVDDETTVRDSEPRQEEKEKTSISRTVGSLRDKSGRRKVGAAQDSPKYKRKSFIYCPPREEGAPDVGCIMTCSRTMLLYFTFFFTGVALTGIVALALRYL